MADDVLDFLPLFPNEDEETILARMRAWANEGLDPDEDADVWVDTSEGSQWHVCVRMTVIELARFYDVAGTEAVAAGFPVWSWGEYLDDHAEVVDIVRLPATSATGEVTFFGVEGTLIASGTTVGVEPVDPEQEVPEFAVVTGGTIPVGGELTLVVRATEEGVAGRVSAGAITEFSTPPPVGVTVTNAAPTVGGTEAETDEALRERVLGAYQGGQGAGNKRWYEGRARDWAGVGRATVIPLWMGPGTVKIIISDADGNAVSPEVVAGLQADLDPVEGMGEGEAPVSAIVTVTTAVTREIEIEAEIEFESGYSLDGFGGTIATRAQLVAGLRSYVERVESGGEVVVSQLNGRLVAVRGVHDARVTSLEGVDPPVNVTIDDDPAEAPRLATPVLTDTVL